MKKFKLKRTFLISDALMYEFSDDTLTNLEDDLHDFTQKDSGFSLEYIEQVNGLIETARRVPSETIIDAQSSQLTKIMNMKNDRCCQKFQNAKRYIEKAFDQNSGIWNEFGYSNYMKASQDSARMVVFMEDFYEAADKYRSELNGVNYTDNEIDEIETIGESFRLAYKNQRKFLNLQLSVTAKRINTLNAIWVEIVDICKVGKTIYQDEYAKYIRYILPFTEENPKLFLIKGKTTNAESFKSEKGVKLIANPGGVSVFSDSNGNFGMVKMDENIESVTAIKAGFASQTKPMPQGEQPYIINFEMKPVSV